MSPIYIVVRTTIGSFDVLLVRGDETVSELKQRLLRRLPTHPSLEQTLIYRGWELLDGTCLSEYPLEQECTVLLLRRPFREVDGAAQEGRVARRPIGEGDHAQRGTIDVCIMLTSGYYTKISVNLSGTVDDLKQQLQQWLLLDEDTRQTLTYYDAELLDGCRLSDYHLEHECTVSLVTAPAGPAALPSEQGPSEPAVFDVCYPGSRFSTRPGELSTRTIDFSVNTSRTIFEPNETLFRTLDLGFDF